MDAASDTRALVAALEATAAEPTPDDREALLALLQRLEPPHGAGLTAPVARHLGDAPHPDPDVRAALVRLASALPDPHGALQRALASRVLEDPQPRVRRLALAAATRAHPGPASRAATLAALTDADEHVARAALIALCEAPHTHETLGEAGRDAVVRYVRERDPNQAGRAGRLLARSGDRRATALLLDAVEHGSHFWHDAGRRPVERAEAFAALAASADGCEPETRARIAATLEHAARHDTYSYGREAALQGLAALGGSRDALRALYLEAAPATHPPSDRRARAAFEPHAERARLAASWAPRLDCDDTQLRADARAIVRWIKRAELAGRVREAAGRVPPAERPALEQLAHDLQALAAAEQGQGGR